MAKEKLLLDVSLDYEQPQRHGWCSDLSKFLCECAPVPAIGFVSRVLYNSVLGQPVQQQADEPMFHSQPPWLFLWSRPAVR